MLRTITNMFEYKIFEASASTVSSMNTLLARITLDGWEPVQMDMANKQVLAKKSILLNERKSL